jgi:FlaA1/EpsC-like NDP-sugar epimerase
MNLLLLTTYQRRAIIVLYDAFCILLSYYLGYALRYESLAIKDYDSPHFFTELALTFTIQLTTLLLMGVHRGLWRFASTKDLILILKSVAMAITASLLGTFFFNRLEFTPRSIYVLDAILLVTSLSAGRFFYRMLKQTAKSNHTENAILIGAGVAGEQLIREFAKNPSKISYDISCVLDDDTKKHGRTIHGIKIAGNISSLPNVVKKYDASTVLIAIPTADNITIRKIYDLAKPMDVKVNTLPPIVDLLSGKVSFKQMREVQVEDLMGRNIANLDLDKIAHGHTNKVIMITGAGGSIGSELCRQVLQYKPSKLIMVDNSELNIYKIGEEFLNKKFNSELIYKTVSVTDRETFDSVFEKYKPEIVYHAAAYKHVPIMEVNPISAIDTNILGTKVACELSVKHQVKKFILVSTDKAVNPTNVMGTTKRIAEMTCEYYQTKGSTIFSMVRFGNVLGSSGSVIPKFKEQILKGGPVTVTHPDITRFFMAIPEAAQLVIQAGCMANGGEIFLLNMGQPVKIVDLAKELITLSGFEVDTEIKIEFTGLRPGEKLFEELLADSESTLPTSHEMVRVGKTRELPENFEEIYFEILNIKPNTSKNEVKMALHRLVNEYTPQFEGEETSSRELQ